LIHDKYPNTGCALGFTIANYLENSSAHIPENGDDLAINEKRKTTATIGNTAWLEFPFGKWTSD
jgi:hypothetical protein